MWRLCDLHNHTPPNEQADSALDADAYVASAIDQGLDVIAVTDHDTIERVEPIQQAADGTSLTVIAGVELSTDRGHIVVIAPDEDGMSVLEELITRVSARPDHQIEIEELLRALEGVRTNGRMFRDSCISIGAHVDLDGCLLGSPNQLGIDGQISLAAKLDALEVSQESVLSEWQLAPILHGVSVVEVLGCAKTPSW